jgi:hypothetical protein
MLLSVMLCLTHKIPDTLQQALDRAADDWCGEPADAPR